MTHAILGLTLAACATGGPASASQVVALAVEPATVVIETGPDAPGTVDFEAVATFADGTTEAIDLVSWSLSNFASGEIATDGLFTASQENGAISSVIAEHAGISATAELTVRYRQTVDESGSGAAVEDFDGTAQGSVSWLYPEDGVRLPRNVPSLSFMWSAVAGARAYRLGFTTEITEVYLLTTATHATVDTELWQVIAATNAGGEVTVEVRAVGEGGIAASEARTVTVNRMDAQGSIYYWSTTDAGIVRVPIDAAEPEPFYTPFLNAPNCVACHAVRESRMGVAYGIENQLEFYAGIVDISGDEPTELTARDREGFYSTLDPEGQRMFTSNSRGTLDLWDAQLGTWLAERSIEGLNLTQPDWSPDGTQIVAVAAQTLYGACCFNKGQLVLVPVDTGGNLGPATTLYAPEDLREDTLNVFYPSFSPDGRWVAFNVAWGGGYDNADAALWVVSVDGGEPIELAAANQGPSLTNSWPHWGPLPDDDVFWLTFSSRRAYGDLITDARPQVWVAAFRPDLAEVGEDPSSPAFWLPNQDPETSNHTTFWGP